MKNFLSAILIIFFFVPVCFALGIDSNNTYDATKTFHDKDYDSLQEKDKEGCDDFYNELIAPDYGSIESPAFNNRENINPNESSYDYGSSEAAE